MEKPVEKAENINLEEYQIKARAYEDEMIRGQLTHIRNCEPANYFRGQGARAVPFILERLKSKILWFIPLQNIITDVFDEEIEEAEVQKIREESADPIENKYSYLEGHRIALLEWAKKRGYLSEEQK